MKAARVLGFCGVVVALMLAGCSDDNQRGGTGGAAGGATGGTGGQSGTGGAADGGTGGAAGQGGSAGSTDGGTGGTGGAVTDYAPTSVDGMTILFNETGGPSNTWVFSTSTAQLEGVDTFPYTFEKTDINQTVIVFDVQGNDQYDMTWESANGGSCEESFNGVPGNACTFVVQ